MDIIFTNDDRSQILHLPIIPERLEIQFPHSNQTFTTISSGEINLIGLPALKSISFSCWFPMKEYSFAKSNVLGSEAKEFIVEWKRTRTPRRMVVINNNGYELHNELYAIENFVFGYDRVGDMTYTLDLKQFVNRRVVY